MRMTIADTEIKVAWENNPSVKALEEMCRDGELTIQMSRYGGFEQVGSIGKSLPRKDVQTKTSPGDIVLYSGSQMVMFYGSNSWAYTRLGTAGNKGCDGNSGCAVKIQRRKFLAGSRAIIRKLAWLIYTILAVFNQSSFCYIFRYRKLDKGDFRI
nr:cyclophilin-like fold protein [uncultured Anaerostipes sp.]